MPVHKVAAGSCVKLSHLRPGKRAEMHLGELHPMRFQARILDIVSSEMRIALFPRGLEPSDILVALFECSIGAHKTVGFCCRVHCFEAEKI